MKKLSKIFYLLIVFGLFGACSSLSKNMVTSGEFILSKSKSKDYTFNRYSWYQELTLNFDLMIRRVEKNDSLYDDFSIKEKDLLKNCQSIYIALSYQLDSKRISFSDLRLELSKNQVSEIETPYFSKVLRMNPSFIEESLQLYKFHTFCSKRNKLDLNLIFPGFKAQVIHL